MKLSKIIPIVLIPLTVFICLCIINSYVHNTQDRLYLSITAFDLPQSDSFTIGENSDVCYKGVPENYMTVHYASGSYSYVINNTDNCLYYKINNNNPNAHDFTMQSIISAFGIEKSGRDIIDLLNDFDNEYYMLSEIWAKLDTTWKHSANYQSIERGETAFNSFIYKKDGKYNLIILDTYTRLNNVGYCYADTLKQGNDFKLQFFYIKSWSMKYQEKDIWDYLKFWDNPTYLHDNERSYFAKPMQMFTEWGAGHIKVTHKDDTPFSVTFPKAITTTIPTKTIREIAQKSETGVYLKQMLKSYPMPTDFYIPAFSNALSEFVCELTKADMLIFQKPNDRDTIPLATSGSFFPEIKKDTQRLVAGGIEYKARILDKGFYWSKHYLLLIVWLFLSILLFLSLPILDTDEVKNVRCYIIGMFTLFWFFLNQKLLIAEKLTFTYPYFEKIYPVSYLTTLFSLFVVFLLIVLINRVYFKVVGHDKTGFNIRNFRTFKNPKKLEGKRVINFDLWLCKIIIVVVIISICYRAINQLKTSFISPIWNAYLSGEISIHKPTSDAMNDNHFTVLVIVGVLLSVLLGLFFIPQKWRNALAKPLQWVNGLLEKKFLIKHISFVVFILILVFFGVGFFVPGNWFTAVAVLILLFLLSFLMQKYTDKIPDDRYHHFIFKKWMWESREFNKFDWNRNWFGYNLLQHKLWLWIIGTLALCCAFVGIGLSDFGFFINVFGIGITWIILIFCCARYKAKNGPLNKKILNTNFIAGLVLGIVLVGGTTWLYVSHNSNPEEIDYSRSTRRVQNCIDPDKVKEAGYLYTESDMQWMEVMRHYAQKVKAGRGDDYDIYGEENNFHQLVASGQSPVILNDVCVPGVYLGSLRCWGWAGLLWGVVALGLLVYWFSIGDTWRQNPKNYTVNRQLIGRLLAGNLWIGVTLYLLASYYWCVPFTGRLIPGFGVDAVGEALEIIVLFAFMCALGNPFIQNNNN
jgi:hypothetical protein